jgi:hypothetical protein
MNVFVGVLPAATAALFAASKLDLVWSKMCPKPIFQAIHTVATMITR